MISNIDHLNLTVDNFKETVTWYKDVLGFELVEEAIQDGLPWGVIKSGNAMLCIYEAPKRILHDRFELQDKQQHGLNHFALRIENEDKFLQKAKEFNLEFEYDGVIQWPHSKAWYIKDPTGYEIEVSLWHNNTIAFDQAIH